MSGGYLRQLQLTKQLEQQAKEAARNREAAERKLEEAERAVASAKEIDANVGEAQKSLVEGNQAYSSKDYKGALAFATKAIESAQAVKEERIASIAGSAQELLDLISGVEGDSTAPRALIERAQGMIAEGELEEAYRIANEAWDSAEQFFNGHMADELGRAQSLLLLAEREGIDTSGEREVLSQSRKALERSDYRRSIEQLRRCLEAVTDSLRMRFHSRAQGIRGRVDAAEDLSEELGPVLGTLEEAEVDLREGRIEDAFSKLTITEGDLKKGFSRSLLSRLELLERREDLLTSLGKDLSAVERMLADGKELARSQDFEGSMSKLREVREASREIEIDALVENIASLRSKLVIARRVGKDLSVPLGELRRARELGMGGEFETALEAVGTADKALEDLLKDFRRVEEELSRVESLSTLAADLGVNLEPSREYMKKAKGLALKGRTDQALGEIATAQSDLNRRIQETVGSMIMRAEIMLAAAIRMDLDVSRENTLIEELSARVRGGDYADTLPSLEELSAGLRERITCRAREGLNRVRKLVERFEAKIDVISAKELLAKAEGAFEEGDYVHSFEMTGEAIRTLESEEEEVLEHGLQEASSLLEVGRKLGVESITLEEKLASVRRLRDEGNIMAAVDVVDEIIHFANTIVREEIEEKLGEVSVSISTARKMGVATGQLEHMVEEITDTMEKGEMGRGLDLTQEIESKLDETIARHKEVKEKLEDIEDIISDARNAKLQISGPSALLEEAKASFAKGEYDKAMASADKCCDMIEKLISPFMSSRKIQEAKNLLAMVKRIGAEPPMAQAEIDRAEKLVESREHAQALRLAKEAIKGLRKMTKENLLAQIEESRKLVSTAADLRTDVVSLTGIIDKAEKLLEEDKLTDAMRAIGLVKKELDQGLQVERRAAEGIERAGAVIAGVRKVGLTPKDPMDLLQQAKSQHRDGKSNIALELARKAADMAADMAKRDIGDRLKKLEMNYREMKLEGPDLDKAIAPRGEIKDRLERWRFAEALSLFNAMEAEIERVRKQKELSGKSVAEVAARVEEARAEGLASEKVDSLLQLSRKRLEEGAFTEAFSISIRCGDELRALQELHSKRSEELRSLRRELEQASKEGIDTSDLEHLIENAAANLKDLEFEEVSLSLGRARTALRKKMGVLYKQRIEELESLLALSSEIGIDASTLPPFIQKLVESGSKRAGSAMVESAAKGLREIRELIRARQEERARELDGRIQVALNSGVDVSLSQELLGKAGKALSEGHLGEANSLLAEGEESIGVAVEERREYVDLKLRCESLIEAAKRNGLTMKEVVDRFREAQARKKDDFSEAIRLMKEALEMAEEEAASYLPQIVVDIDFQGEPRTGDWMKGTVKLKNEGVSMAREVGLTFMGEVEVRGLEVIKKLRGGEGKTVSFELMPHRSGQLDITFSLNCRPVLSEDNWGYESSFVLDVP